MNDIQKIRSDIFKIATASAFNDAALAIFRHQSKKNAIYSKYLQLLSIDPLKIKSVSEIPFLPIQFFKSHKLITGEESTFDAVFLSSGTSGSDTSKHYVKDTQHYQRCFRASFERFYGLPEDYCFLALLPSYLEREGSSLIYMMEDLISLSRENGSGFYLDDHQALLKKYHEIKGSTKVMVFGVSYALLDLAEAYHPDLSEAIIMETGGMKGRRKEMVRAELHQKLCGEFNVKKIHSEYGMTELMSQAYSQGKGVFKTPGWMRVMIRDMNDPLSFQAYGKTGGINIIDLGNIDSCAFIATQDLGKTYADGSFEVLGRFDDSDVRGCNLMVY